MLLSARRVGPRGKAYGLDMTDDMLALARENQRKSGIENVEFLKGEIENIPLPDNTVDVVISNCVINLSGDKDRVLSEAFRVLKPGAASRYRTSWCGGRCQQKSAAISSYGWAAWPALCRIPNTQTSSRRPALQLWRLNPRAFMTSRMRASS